MSTIEKDEVFHYFLDLWGRIGCCEINYSKSERKSVEGVTFYIILILGLPFEQYCVSQYPVFYTCIVPFHITRNTNR